MILSDDEPNTEIEGPENIIQTEGYDPESPNGETIWEELVRLCKNGIKNLKLRRPAIMGNEESCWHDSGVVCPVCLNRGSDKRSKIMNLICPDCNEEMVRYRYENPEGDWIFGWLCECNEETRMEPICNQNGSKPKLGCGEVCKSSES